MKERKKISKVLKDLVKHRQNGKCVCCLNSIRHMHHILAFSISGDNLSLNNIVGLCIDHHRLFHLGDPETFQMIYEYAYYINEGVIPPENIDIIEISENAINDIKNRIVNVGGYNKNENT